MTTIVSTAARLAVPALLTIVPTALACAQTDEIQVYNAEIAAPGTLNLTVHNNYTPSGRMSPAFPGASFRITL